MAFGIHGPSITSAAACASGIQAFIDAYHMFQRDEADVILTGGTESGITPVAVAGLANMQALSKRNDDPAGASRPFDAERDGFVFSEGSAVFVLETEEHALARGANIIAEVHGGAYTSDAYHITAPHPEGRGAATAMTRAIERAGFAADRCRLRRRACDRDVDRRCRRDQRAQEGLRRPRLQAGDLGQQVDGRAPARRGRRGLRARLRDGDPRQRRAPDDQPARRPIRSAIWTTCRT